MSTPSVDAEAAELAALVEEAAKKSGLVWVNGQAVWHAWVDGALCLVGGPGEQPLPGLSDGGTAQVTARSKDKGGRLVSWTARAELLAPEGEPWQAAVAELKGKRLNAPDGEAMPDRWARTCDLFRLTARGRPAEYPGAMPDTSGAAVPVATPPPPAGPRPPPCPGCWAGSAARADRRAGGPGTARRPGAGPSGYLPTVLP